MKRMTNKSKKGTKTHIIAFSPAWITQDPWVIHGQWEYLLLHIDTTADKHRALLMQQRKWRTLEGWLKYPKDNW
jgi:hypothetical protein